MKYKTKAEKERWVYKSSKVSIAHLNTGKLKTIKSFINEYRKVCQYFVDLLWDCKDPPLTPSKKITNSVDTWLSARSRQAAAKQASGIVRGTRVKKQRMLWVYNQLVDAGHHKKARKLLKKINKTTYSKPDIKNLQPHLDSRFIKWHDQNTTKFDAVISLHSLFVRSEIKIPFKYSKHLNGLINKSDIMLSGFRFSENSITFNFGIERPPIKADGKTIGIDIGIKDALSLSDGTFSAPDCHGHTLESITKKLSRKKKGSKSFKRTQIQRKNYTNWVFNQIDLSKINTMRIERLKNVRYKKRYSRYLSHFTYTEFRRKAEDLCNSTGVQLVYVNPAFTSQRCADCGWVQKKNRNGKMFVCLKCGHTADADTNAAINISLPLAPLGPAVRKRRLNRKGFYWSLNEGSL